MSKERFQITIVLEIIAGILCIVAGVIVKNQLFVKLFIVALGLIWFVAAYLNYLQWKEKK